MFTNTQLNIIKYCAEECKRQQSGELSVYDMVDAWNFAIEHSNEDSSMISKNFIENLGRIVEPQDNHSGFRRIPIFVGNAFQSVEKMNWERIPEALNHLISSYYQGNFEDVEEIKQNLLWREHWSQYKFYEKAKLPEDIFYFEYEEIHPFRDGNGRTGKILYNYLRGTLENPQMPPNFWGSSNP